MSVTAAAALVAAVAVMAITGTREPAAAVKLLAGDIWLANTATGSVSHVNGYTGRADAPVTIGLPGDPLTVVQRPDGAYVLDQKTGKITRIADTTGSAAPTSPPPHASGAALQVVTGGNITWLLDHSSGVVQRTDPTSLAATGAPIPLGAATGIAISDNTGDLLVPIPSKGAVDTVTPGGGVTSQAVGQAGDQVELAQSSRGIWAIDATGGLAVPLTQGDQRSVPFTPDPSQPLPIIGSDPSSTHVVISETGHVYDLNTASSSLASLSVPNLTGPSQADQAALAAQAAEAHIAQTGANAVSQASVAQGRLDTEQSAAALQAAVSNSNGYFLDPSSGQLSQINLDSPTGTTAVSDVPPGTDQVVTNDQTVFLNDSNGNTAATIPFDNPTGLTPISKYQIAPGDPSGPGTPHAPPGVGTLVPGTGTTPSNGPPSGGEGGSSPAGQGSGARSPSGTGSNPGNGSHPGGGPTAPTLPVIPATTTPVTVPVTQPTPTAPGGTSPATTAPRNTAPPTTATPATSPPTTAEPVPSRVTGVTVQAGAQEAVASWTAVTGDPTLAYSVVYTVSGKTQTKTVSATQDQIKGLPDGAQVCVKVTAVDKAGSGPFSTPACATTEDVPGPVSNLSLTPGAGQLKASWKAPKTTGGSAVTGYKVTVNGTAHTTTSTSLSLTATEWTNYTVSVVAVNAIGSGTPAVSGTAYVSGALAPTNYYCQWNGGTAADGAFEIHTTCDSGGELQTIGPTGWSFAANSSAAADLVVCSEYAEASGGFYYEVASSQSACYAKIASDNVQSGQTAPLDKFVLGYASDKAGAFGPGTVKVTEYHGTTAYQGGNVHYDYELWPTSSGPKYLTAGRGSYSAIGVSFYAPAPR